MLNMQSGAPIYRLADDQRARNESATWARFTAPADSAERLGAWLALLASRLPRARAALLLTRGADGATFSVAAVWPDPRRDLQYLAAVAERALRSREGVVSAPGSDEAPGADGAAHVAYPVEMDGALCAAVVVDIAPGAVEAMQDLLRQIHWGAAWLVDQFRAELLGQRERELARIDLLNQIQATAMQHRRLQPSALAVANELVQRLSADRVSIGFEQHGQIVPMVLSNTASFDRRSDLVRWIGEAMDEALDLSTTVTHPAAAGQSIAALAHAESARQLAVQALLSVPVRDQGQTLGVITLERSAGPAFDARTAQIAAAVGVLLGPYWGLQQERERGLLQRGRTALTDGMRELAGPAHPGLKLLALLGLVFLLVVALWRTDYRVAARTVVEGSVQIASVAPFDGFIAAGLVRAGDNVKKGQPLARLDDRDLQLEHSRWSAERAQLRRKYDVAQSQADRATMGVFAAQIHQAEAQLWLAEERLARATLVAPFDGLVVYGDLSQQIGSPVETGRVLFEVAPLAGFRVMMQIEDRDIVNLALGQQGQLLLSGMPERPLPITVQRITPVASQHDGRNVFVVEAAIDGSQPPALRPGMEGVAKVSVGQRRLLWIWTHGLLDWLRLASWSWLP